MTQPNKQRAKELKVQRELWRDLRSKDKFNQLLFDHANVTKSLFVEGVRVYE